MRARIQKSVNFEELFSRAHVNSEVLNKVLESSTIIVNYCIIINAHFNLKKVNQSHYRPEVPRGFQEVKVPRSRYNGPGWWQVCQSYAPAAFYPQEMLLVLISVRG